MHLLLTIVCDDETSNNDKIMGRYNEGNEWS